MDAKGCLQKAAWALGLAWSLSASADSLPKGLSFVGLSAGQWAIHYVDGNGVLTRVETATEPRTPTLALKTGRLAYVSADGHLREMTLADHKESVLLQADGKRAFTQPAYDERGERLFVVELHEGASVETDILVFDQDRQGHKPLIIQRSAQFEPRVDGRGNLYYSNVHCTLGCGKIIQEIWVYRIASGEADQISLVNHIARQPAPAPDGKSVYFASDQDGNFHIWRLDLASRRMERLTDGLVTDTDPAVDGNAVYFIRRTAQKTELMRLQAGQAARPVALPAEIIDIRDLEIVP